VARWLRWSCQRATIPRYRGTRTRKVRDPRTPGFRLGKTGRRRRQGGLRRKAHPEPLASFADRKASRAFHENPAERPGLALHYQCRDYAPLQSRPSLPRAIRTGPYRSERRTPRSAVAAGGSCMMRASTPAPPCGAPDPVWGAPYPAPSLRPPSRSRGSGQGSPQGPDVFPAPPGSTPRSERTVPFSHRCT